MASVAQPASSERVFLSRRQWIFLILLVISICISYIDRGSLSVADKYLQTEFSLDPEHRGMIYSAFFWWYAPALVLAGWLVDRFDVNKSSRAATSGMVHRDSAHRRGQRLSMLSSSACCSAWAGPVAYPAYRRASSPAIQRRTARLRERSHRRRQKLGPALGILIGGLLMASYGWRIFFVITGGLSMAWLIPWFLRARKAAPPCRPETGKVPGFGEILSKRAAWGTFIGLFCGNYVWYFIITWLPSYFRDELHFDQRQMAVFASAPLWVLGLGSNLRLDFRSLDRQRTSPNLVRKTFTGLGLGL